MNRTNLGWVTVMWLLIFMAATVPVCAQTQSDEWEYIFAPYLVIPGMKGTVGVKGVEAEVNASASDVFSNLQMGFNGYFGARKGNWGFGTDIVYAALGGSSDRVNW